MKKLNVILLSLLLSTSAFASIRAFNSSGVDIGHFADMKAASGVALTNDAGKLKVNITSLPALTGDVVGDGGDQLYGFRQEHVAASTTALTAAQCGATIINAGAVVQPLPEASTVLGCRYTFVAATNDDFDIDPADATDHFGRASIDGAAIDGAAGDEYRLTDIGTSITIQAVTADIWAVISHNGPITDVD